MHIILGGTGHVGSAVATALLAHGEPVTIVTRNDSRAAEWRGRGAQVAIADAHDVASLRRVFRQGRRLFLLNPPADPSTDTDVEERKTVAAMVAALEGSGLEKIVAQSTYGAQAGERCGDLTTLYDLEQSLRAQSIPVSIVRAAYYMSNWDFSLETAEKEGVVQTLFPADFKLPMVAPQDLGRVAARLLVEPVERLGLHYVEGPERYTPADVAKAFADVLSRSVQVVTVPRADWKETFKSMGFSEPAAESYARMTAATVDGQAEMPDRPERGQVSLTGYIAELAKSKGGDQ
jgi:uncharacterized protein YbjT (DUF2867 family)